jgi:hypothetical protein
VATYNVDGSCRQRRRGLRDDARNVRRLWCVRPSQTTSPLAVDEEVVALVKSLCGKLVRGNPRDHGGRRQRGTHSDAHVSASRRCHRSVSPVTQRVVRFSNPDATTGWRDRLAPPCCVRPLSSRRSARWVRPVGPPHVLARSRGRRRCVGRSVDVVDQAGLPIVVADRRIVVHLI